MEKFNFNQIAAHWQEEKRKYVKQSTYATYVLIVESHLRPMFGNMHEIAEKDVQDFVISKLASRLSQKYIKDILIVLKMIVRFGEKHHGMPHHEWDIHYPTQIDRPTIKVLSASDHKRILHHIRENFNFRNLGIYISLTTGLRIGEVCGLKWSDINITDATLTVSRTVERIYIIDEAGNRHTEISVSSPKTANSEREIPIGRQLLTILRPLKKVVNPDFFILSNDTTPIEPRTYRNYYNLFLKELGIPHLKFHGLRHSFATRCIESDCDYKTVSVILGHANISTTLNLYVHPGKEHKKKCIDKMLQALK